MIVLRSPKGWTCPKEIDGKRTEGTGARTRCPWGRCTRTPRTYRILEQWMKSYRPEELFDDGGGLRAGARRARPAGIAA